MKYKIVESVKNKTTTNIPCDDEFTFSVYNADSQIVESLQKEPEEVSEAYEYSDYDKKLLVNRAKSIAKRIYDLYNDAGTEASGELGSANEIAQDLLTDTAKIDMYTKFLSKVVAKKPVKNQIDKLLDEIKSFKAKFERMRPKVQESIMKVRDLKESKEVDRDLFVSLVDLGNGSYSILNDGYFVTKVYADNVEEAKRIFKDFLKSDWKQPWKNGDLHKTSANEFLGESIDKYVGNILTEAEVPIRLSMDDMTNSDNFNLGNKVKKEVADENKRIADEKARKEAEEAERVRQERISELKNKYKDVFDILDSEMDLKEKKEKLFDVLEVPASGKADTVAGELIRALCKIDYRWFNDGDICFMGYGLETCGSALSYIIETIELGEDKKPVLELLGDCADRIEYNAGSDFGDYSYPVNSRTSEDYDKFLDDLFKMVFDWISENPDKDFEETRDMFDKSEHSEKILNTLEELEPLVEISFDENTAYDLFNYVWDYDEYIDYSDSDLVNDFVSDSDWWGCCEGSEVSKYGSYATFLVKISRAAEFYNKMESWCKGKLDELIDEYGEDPSEEEEEEEEEIDESISNDIRKNNLKYDPDVDALYSEDGGTYAQIQDRENHEYAPLKVKTNKYGGKYIGNENSKVRPKVSTHSWGRVWKDGKLDKQFDGPKYKVRQDMARYLENESMNETMFGGKGGNIGGPVALDPECDEKKARKVAKKAAKSAKKAAKQARKLAKKEVDESMRLNESVKDEVIWTSDEEYQKYIQASDGDVEEFLDWYDKTIEDFDGDYDKARQWIADMYSDGEEEYTRLREVVIPSITSQVVNNCLVGIGSRGGWNSGRGVLDFSENMNGWGRQVDTEEKITNFLYNDSAYNLGLVYTDADGVVCLGNDDHDGSTRVALYTAPTSRKLNQFVKNCTNYPELAMELRSEYNDDLTIDEIAEDMFLEDMNSYGFSGDLEIKDGVSFEEIKKYMTPIIWEEGFYDY